jgi:hypothetical protein
MSATTVAVDPAAGEGPPVRAAERLKWLAAERLASEAVRELAATGGAVVDVHDQPTAIAGAWPVPPVVRMPIPGGRGSLKWVLVGPRVDGQPHDPRSIAQLEEVAALVAAAARLPAGSP